MVEIKNAIIKSVNITNDAHGFLSAWIHLEYDTGCQGFGGYALYAPKREAQEKNYCGLFIWRVMKIVGVEEWSQLPGKTIRAKTEHSKCHAIGHILKDDWFNPQEEFEEIKNA